MILTADLAEIMRWRFSPARQMRCVDADHAGDPLGDQHGRVPDENTAPVMADEDSALMPERIEQASEVGHQRVDIIFPGALRAVRTAKTAQIRRDHPVAGPGEDRDLVFPGISQLWPAMEQQQRLPVFRAGQMHGKLDTIGLDAGRCGKIAHESSCLTSD